MQPHFLLIFASWGILALLYQKLELRRGEEGGEEEETTLSVTKFSFLQGDFWTKALCVIHKLSYRLHALWQGLSLTSLRKA